MLRPSRMIRLLAWHFVHLCFFFPPSHFLSKGPSFLSLLVAAQIRGHKAGSSTPSPLRFKCLAFFIASKTSAPPFPLVDSRRIVPTHARRSQQSIPFVVLQMYVSHHGGIRTPGPTPAAFEGNCCCRCCAHINSSVQCSPWCHRTGSNNSGAENYLRRKSNKNRR